MFRDRIAYKSALLGSNMYVPAMQYSSALVLNEPEEFSLGTPAASNATVIATATNAQAVANTIVAYNYTSDAAYGRNLILTISGNPGNSHAVDIFGFDYLGQPLIERFTGASGATAILYGQKCFYRVVGSKIITASSNAVTFGLGTGTRLGLPFKADIEYAKEGGILVPLTKRDTPLGIDRPAALAIAGGSVFVRAPSAGYVKSVRGYSYGAGSTNDPVITVKLATVAIVGLTVTIDANVSTTASIVSGNPTTPGYNANNRCIAGDLIEIVGTAAASAGGDHVEVLFTPTQFTFPDLTDPATRTTGEPRGSYESNVVLNGSTEIIVALMGDNNVNAAGNGGLHGIRHLGA